MSYSICYGPTTLKESARKLFCFKSFCIVIVVIFVIAMCCFFPESSRRFVQTLFPWTGSATKAAFSEFCEGIRAGEPVSTAFNDFCVELVQNAQKPT